MCMMCRSLFVLSSFFFWPLCCLFFIDLHILITPLVSLSSSYSNGNHKYATYNSDCNITIYGSTIILRISASVSIFDDKDNTIWVINCIWRVHSSGHLVLPPVLWQFLSCSFRFCLFCFCLWIQCIEFLHFKVSENLSVSDSILGKTYVWWFW